MQSVAYVELFHLMFLRQFNAQIDSALYAIKGGCNLRFFFNSVRYSEDLDIDVCKIAPNTLSNKVDKILSTKPLMRLLQSFNITDISCSAPKQTPTTQHWKIQLQVENLSLPLHTKIEFSRRQEQLTNELAGISAHICQSYQLPPLRLAHYRVFDALQQKVLALAKRTLTQARDVFDLYHLLHLSPGNNKLPFETSILTEAETALLSISYQAYQSQVVNFLEISQQANYDSESYWQEMVETIFKYLNEQQL